MNTLQLFALMVNFRSGFTQCSKCPGSLNIDWFITGHINSLEGLMTDFLFLLVPLCAFLLLLTSRLVVVSITVTEKLPESCEMCL